MVNEEVAAVFSQIADLMDIKGEDGFRINTYRRAARTLGDLTQDLRDLAAAGKIEELPGIGKSTREKIEQYLRTGKIELHAELLASVPAGLPPLLDIPGLGPKKVAAVWKELGVENLDALKQSIHAGTLAKLKGFGTKSVEQISHGIEFMQRATGRTPMGLAWPLAQELAQALRDRAGVQRIDIAGSLRRGAETVGDIDLICELSDSPPLTKGGPGGVGGSGAALVKQFTELPQVVRVLAAGDTKGSVIVQRRDGFEVQAQLRVIPRASYGAGLMYFTGSKEHNVRLRELAIKKKWKLSEWGLFDGDKQIAGADEAAVYKKLGLPFIPPELREDRGEIEAAKELPKLIERSDIRGDFHMHTAASDGTVAARDMAEAAAKLGYEYIAIADHSKSSTIANGLSIDRMWRQIEMLRKLNDSLKTVSVLVACECDVLADGSLDYPDPILAACDLVVASVHSGMRGSREANTKRAISAMENRFVTILGHPTGRLLNKRDAMELDMQAVIAAAARTGTALELNASWQRLDLHDRHVKMARDAGVMLTIDTDSHAIAQLDQMDYGIRTARRGWLTPEHVLNTRPLVAVKRWIAKKRKGKK